MARLQEHLKYTTKKKSIGTNLLWKYNIEQKSQLWVHPLLCVWDVHKLCSFTLCVFCALPQTAGMMYLYKHQWRISWTLTGVLIQILNRFSLSASAEHVLVIFISLCKHSQTQQHQLGTISSGIVWQHWFPMKLYATIYSGDQMHSATIQIIQLRPTELYSRYLIIKKTFYHIYSGTSILAMSKLLSVLMGLLIILEKNQYRISSKNSALLIIQHPLPNDWK